MSKKVEINIGVLGGLNLFLENLFFYLTDGGHISNKSNKKRDAFLHFLFL